NVKTNWMRDNISGSRLIGPAPDMPLPARSGALEAEDRDLGGNDETVHAGDVLVRVDEQPFPVERYGLDIERLVVWRQRPRWIELGRLDPRYAPDEHDRQQRQGTR